MIVFMKEGIVLDPYMSVLFMLAISFPEAMLMSYLAIQFMGRRPIITEIILIGLIQSVIAYIARNLSIPVGVHTIVLTMTNISLIFIIARMKLWSASVGFIIVLIIYIFQEILVSQLIVYVTGITLPDLINNPYMRIIIFIPLAAILFITIIIFKKYDLTFAKVFKSWNLNGKHNVNKVNYEQESNIIHKEYLLAVIFIFLPVFLLFILNFAYVSVYFEDKSGYYSDLFKNLINVLIVLLAFVSIWALKRISRAIEKEYEAKKAAETMEQLKELIFSIRKQRHDFNHHLQVVYGLIETGGYSEAREYIKNTYHMVSGTGELIKTDNTNISALIYAKIGIAETRNIRFDINIECSLEEFPLTSTEASSLFGNLIDNAFDVVEGNVVEKRKVRLEIVSERGEYLVDVANCGEPLNSEFAKKIFKPSFTTKKGHAGLGLVIVKEIAEKYNGNLQVLFEEGETVFRASIPFRR